IACSMPGVGVSSAQSSPTPSVAWRGGRVKYWAIRSNSDSMVRLYRMRWIGADFVMGSQRRATVVDARCVKISVVPANAGTQRLLLRAVARTSAVGCRVVIGGSVVFGSQAGGGPA